jgi:DnaJ-class molecular chaperone
VQKDTPKYEIQAAYKKLARHWHPDRFSDREKKEAEQMKKKINTAYNILGDDEKRRRFDQGIDLGYPGPQGMNPSESFFQSGGMPFHFQQGGGVQGFQFHFGGGHGFHVQF